MFTSLKKSHIQRFEQYQFLNDQPLKGLFRAKINNCKTNKTVGAVCAKI